jgi:hypothetical protein
MNIALTNASPDFSGIAFDTSRMEDAQMADDRKGRLVILSGPSCVGKSPLAKALYKFYPELCKTLKALVLYGERGHPLAGRSRSTDVSIGILLVPFFQLRDP